jgi:DNA-binding transcriptional regulator YhcF (GntR family)
MPTRFSKPNRTGRSDRESRHVRLYHWMIETPAWRDLSGNARAIYIGISSRYRGLNSNNGRIPYSVREAATELAISPATASREFHSLTDHGFIFPVTKGAFSVKSRRATEWRLTEFPCDITGALASKEFARWRSIEIQNTVSVVKPTVPVVKPNGARSETRVAKMARDGG